MHRLLIILFIGFAPLAATAQDTASYNRALAAFNAGELDSAAPLFFELSVSAEEPEVRAKSEYYLAQTFSRKDMPVSALIGYARIVNAGPSHPSYLQALEGLVDVQQRLNESNLVPNILDKAYTPEVRDRWLKLPAEVLARVNYLVGTISQRRGRFDFESFLVMR